MMNVHKGAYIRSLARDALEFLLGRTQRECGGVILVYHAIVDRIRDPDLEVYAIDAATLRGHLDFLRRRCCVVPLRVMMETVHAGKALDPHWVAITCDDGLMSQTGLGREVLAERAVPWSLAVSPGLIESGRPVWSYRLAFLLLRLWRSPSVPRPEGGVWPTRTRTQRLAAIRAIREWVFQVATPEACNAYLDGLAEVCGRAAAEDAFNSYGVYRTASMGAVNDCATGGVELLGHGWSHWPLTGRLSPTRLAEEVEGTAAWLREHAPSPVTGFVLPHGICDSTVTARIRAAYDACFTFRPGRIGPGQDCWVMPRVSAEYPLSVLRRFITRLEAPSPIGE